MIMHDNDQCSIPAGNLPIAIQEAPAEHVHDGLLLAQGGISGRSSVCYFAEEL